MLLLTLLIYFSSSIVMVYIGAFVGGIGFYWTTPWAFTSIASGTPIAAVPMANGLATAVMNGCAFLIPYFYEFVCGISHTDPIRFPFMIGAGFFCIAAVVFFAASRKKKNA